MTVELPIKTINLCVVVEDVINADKDIKNFFMKKYKYGDYLVDFVEDCEGLRKRVNGERFYTGCEYNGSYITHIESNEDGFKTIDIIFTVTTGWDREIRDFINSDNKDVIIND